MSASSTALATFASKISAFDEAEVVRAIQSLAWGILPGPECKAVGFRAVFFFSFFGLIVSLLALVLTLPLPSLPPRSPRSWGIDVTGSVSTVMVRGGSGGLGFGVKLVYDLLAMIGVGFEADGARALFELSLAVGCGLISPSPLASPPSLIVEVSDDGSAVSRDDPRVFESEIGSAT